MVRIFEHREVLRDGTEVVVRPIRPGDHDRLGSFYSHLSPRTRYLRFFTHHPALSDQILNYLTNLDYFDRYALVATLEDEIVGVARYERIDNERAEAAVVVQDDMQSRGLGTLLLTKLGAVARRRGIATFEGDVLSENRQMFDLVRSLGGSVDRELSYEAILADLAWPAPPPSPGGGSPEIGRVQVPLARGALRRILRVIAATEAILLPSPGARRRVARLGKLRSGRASRGGRRSAPPSPGG